MGGVWVILDLLKPHIGAKACVFSGSKIQSVGARQVSEPVVIEPVNTVLLTIFKLYPAKIHTEDTTCRIRGQRQVNRPKAGVPSEEQGEPVDSSTNLEWRTIWPLF
jgi:hypothetical protein